MIRGPSRPAAARWRRIANADEKAKRLFIEARAVVAEDELRQPRSRATSDYGITSPDGRIATTTYDWDPLCEMPTRVVLPEGEVSETSYTSFCSPAWQQAGTDTTRRCGSPTAR